MAEVKIGPNTEAKDRPDKGDKRFDGMAEAWQLVRDVDGGQRRIKNAGSRYLPQHAAEEYSNYRVRLERPCFFNALTRTADGLTGLVFRRDPVRDRKLNPPIPTMPYGIGAVQPLGLALRGPPVESNVERGRNLLAKPG